RPTRCRGSSPTSPFLLSARCWSTCSCLETAASTGLTTPKKCAAAKTARVIACFRWGFDKGAPLSAAALYGMQLTIFKGAHAVARPEDTAEVGNAVEAPGIGDFADAARWGVTLRMNIACQRHGWVHRRSTQQRKIGPAIGPPHDGDRQLPLQGQQEAFGVLYAEDARHAQTLEPAVGQVNGVGEVAIHFLQHLFKRLVLEHH